VNLDELTEVWTPVSAILAVVAGVAYGVLTGWIATNPVYSTGTASAFRIALISFVFAASAGLVFFALQTLGTYLSGDPNWPRVMSRYGQWLLFSLAIAVTTWLLVARDRSRRRRRAHDVAVAELDEPPR
jgi:hypothetical protein